MLLEDCIIIPKTDITEIKQMLKLLLSQNNHNHLSEYVTEDVASVMLGIKKTTLQVWKSNGKIGFHKPEGNKKGLTYYKVSDLLDFQKGIKHKSNKEIDAEANTYLLQKKLKDNK